MKKERPDKDKGSCFEMDLMIQQITTVVRELDEHESSKQHTHVRRIPFQTGSSASLPSLLPAILHPE